MSVSSNPNKSVPAMVIAMNNFVFIEDGQLAPQERIIPCEQAFIDYIPFWAVPTKTGGVFTGLTFTPKQDDLGNAVDQPSYDSFSVMRVRDKLSDNSWWIPCTLDQFTAACASCCGAAYVPVPNPSLPVIAPCQTVCNSVNAEGQYYAIWGAPVLGVGQHYVAYGAYNDGAFVPITASSIADLITQMNTHWGVVGDASPGASVTWSRTDYTIFGTFTSGGSEDDTICLVIQAVD